jgi:SAM-dependent methyltransferase
MVRSALAGAMRSLGAPVPRPLRRLVRRISGPVPAQRGTEETLWELLRPYLPDDHARQVSARYYVERLMTQPQPPKRVMDLGCGRGDSVDLFRRYDPDVDWVGVDIADSWEALQRQRGDARFVTYDGLNIPFRNGTFDLVYSNHVLEHVREPARHLVEIGRVLRPQGSLIGSTSNLEPYHSRSFWNFTPVGFVALVQEARLQLEEIRPGIDGVTLILRSFLGRPASFDGWWDDESPLNQVIDEWAAVRGRRPARVNLRKLEFAGHFAFHVRKPV